MQNIALQEVAGNLLFESVSIQNLLVDISPLLWDKSVCVTPLVQESG